MQTRAIGKTDLRVTEIGFGTASIGNLYRSVTRDAAEDVVDAAWQAGIRYFDTAPFYGFGLAERRLGDALRGKPRADYVLSTKVGRCLSAVPDDRIPDHGFVDPLPFRPDYDYSHDGIMRSLEASLARLGLNRIDILYVHDIGAYTHGDEAGRHVRDLMDGGLRALDRLKREGTIRAFGLGVNEVEVCLAVMKDADLDCILLANRFTLLDRSAVPNLVPACLRKGTTLVVGGVFNSGLLATGPIPGATYEYGPAPPEILGKAARLQRAAEAGGLSLPAAALQFPLRHAVTSSVLIGTAKRQSLERNLDLLTTRAAEDLWGRIDAAAATV